MADDMKERIRLLRSSVPMQGVGVWARAAYKLLGEASKHIREQEYQLEEVRIELRQAHDKIDNHRDLSGAKYLTKRLEEQEKKLAAFRDALPDPDKLDLLAKMFDVALPNDPNPEIQTTLRTWAAKIRALAATEGGEHD